MTTSSQFDAIVIGSGLGGLTAGALAAKRGDRVLLLERHTLFGGAATVFSRPRQKMRVEVGLHEIDGLDQGDIKNTLFDELGINDHMEFIRVPEFYAVHHHSLGKEPFIMPDGLEAAQQATAQRFPKHRTALGAWFSLIERIHGKIQILGGNRHKRWWWLLNSLVFPIRFWPIVRYERTSLGDALTKLFGDDEAVKLALCANLNYYAESPDMSLLFFAAAQGSYHRGGGHYIKGGSSVLTNYLAQVIEDAGGTTLARRPAKEILIRNGKVIGVVHTDRRGKNPEEAYAPIIYGNAAPSLLGEMLPEPDRKAFLEAYADKPLSLSLWSIYIGLDRSPNELGMDYYSSFHVPDWVSGLNDLPACGDLLKAMPNGRVPSYVAVNYDQLDNGLMEGDRSLIVLCGLDRLENWDAVDRRSYKLHKAAWLEAILADFLTKYPKLRDHVVYQEMATAKTVQRYLSTPGGAVYGFDQDVATSGRHRPGAKTVVPGLLLASAFAQPGGGFTGAMLAGENAFRAAQSSSS